MRHSACRWRIVKKAKIFWSYVEHFWILASVRKYRIAIGLYKQVSMNCRVIFINWENKMGFSATFLFLFFRIFKKKKEVLYKIV